MILYGYMMMVATHQSMASKVLIYIFLVLYGFVNGCWGYGIVAVNEMMMIIDMETKENVKMVIIKRIFDFYDENKRIQ